MKFLCPTCRTPLPPISAAAVVPCAQCGVAVDLTRVDTAPGSSALSPEVDLTGEALGPFKLGERLGSGGMGAVYAAEGPPGRCAVKVLATTLGAEPSLRERFRREAAALRQVDHPGVVRVISEGEERGFSWYAMERIDGPDLRARLRDGPLPPREVERLAGELLSALDAVHGRGLVHRDIKPGNILLAPAGAKLCDFGIARFDGSATLTESAALMGSLRYMAPEQRRGLADARSDLYALGLVLFEALSGGLPDEAEAGPTPTRLRRLIESLVAGRPEDRPQSAKAARAWLSAPVWRAHPAASAAAALGVALVLGVGGLRLASSTPPPVVNQMQGPAPSPTEPPPPALTQQAAPPEPQAEPAKDYPTSGPKLTGEELQRLNTEETTKRQVVAKSKPMPKKRSDDAKLEKLKLMKLEAAKKAEANAALDPPPTKVAAPPPQQQLAQPQAQAPNPEPRQFDSSNAAMPLGTKGGRVSFEDDTLQPQQSYAPKGKKRKPPNSSDNEQQQAVQQQR